MSTCLLVRHGETTFNVEGRINGDPAILVPVRARGREEAAELARHIAHVRIDVCVHTRFPRTLETAEIDSAPARIESHWSATRSWTPSMPAIWRASR